MENKRQIYNKEAIHDLKIELQFIQTEKAKLEAELSRLAGKEKHIMEELAKYSDEKYEEDMLQLLYEQRKKKQ